jgi:hypothetical protein
MQLQHPNKLNFLFAPPNQNIFVSVEEDSINRGNGDLAGDIFPAGTVSEFGYFQALLTGTGFNVNNKPH